MERLIYRMEDEQGLGPFTVLPGTVDWGSYNGNPKFPSPATDPGFDQEAIWEKVSRRHVLYGVPLWPVGCCSPEQLRYWFDAETCAELARHGFDYVTLRVPDDKVIEGEFQALFDADCAECVERHPADALWETSTQLSLPLAA